MILDDRSGLIEIENGLFVKADIWLTQPFTHAFPQVLRSSLFNSHNDDVPSSHMVWFS